MTNTSALAELQEIVEGVSEIQPGSAPTADPSMVRAVLGKNLLGAEEWRKQGIDVGAVPPIPSTITEELLNSSCPLHPGSKIKDTHLLVLMPKTVNGELYSALKLDELCASRKGSREELISGGAIAWMTQPWAKELQKESEWILIAKSDPDPGEVPEAKHFRSRTIAQQQAVHDAHYKEYREVRAVELMTATLLNALVNGGPRMLERSLLRCKEASTSGGRVGVGYFNAYGLKVGAVIAVNGFQHVGRALARKI